MNNSTSEASCRVICYSILFYVPELGIKIDMNRTLLPTLIGVFTSLFVIWSLHTFLMVDDCLDHSGSFDYSTGKCLLENGQVYESSLETIALVLYFVVGFGVSFIVSTGIRKLFKMKR